MEKEVFIKRLTELRTNKVVSPKDFFDIDTSDPINIKELTDAAKGLSGELLSGFHLG